MHSLGMARTVRLSSELEQAADVYSEELGISFNALVAVSLRDYLDARKRPVATASQAPGGAVSTLPGVGARSVVGVPQPVLTRQQRRALERKKKGG